uniref:hypothetical protein n=1 Tax=Kingella oralis TaxID=505 RepID=UPI003C6FC55E
GSDWSSDVCSPIFTPSRATLRPLKRLFRAVDTRPAVGRLADALDAVLRAHPQISDIEWQDEQAA